MSKSSLRPTSAPISRPGTSTSKQNTITSQKSHNPSLPPTVPRSALSKQSGSIAASKQNNASVAASQTQSQHSVKSGGSVKQSIVKSAQKAVSVAKSGQTQTESILLDMFPEGQQPGDTDPNPVVVIDYDLK